METNKKQVATIQTLFDIDVTENFKKKNAIEKKECYFIASSNEVLQATKCLKKVAGKKNTLPVLDQVLFEVKDGRVNLTRSDLETNVTTTVFAETKGIGSFCVNFDQLTKFIGTTKEGNLLFKFDFENDFLEIHRDTSVFKLLCHINSNEFPVQKVPTGNNVLLPAALVAEMLAKSIPFTGKDELHEIMLGVNVVIDQEQVKAQATDAHKLSVFSIKNHAFTYEGESFSGVIPKKACELIKQICTEGHEVELIINDTHACIKVGSSVLITQLIAGNFPNVNAVIPQNDKMLKINRKELINVLGRVLVAANRSSNEVRFNLNGLCQLKTYDPDFQTEMNEFIKDYAYNSDEIEIGFNGKDMIEVLRSIDSERVAIMLSEPNRAGVILPMEVKRNTDRLTLLMPFAINE